MCDVHLYTLSTFLLQVFFCFSHYSNWRIGSIPDVVLSSVIVVVRCVLIHWNLRCPRFCRLHECFFLSFSSPSLPSMWVNVPANPWWTVEIFGTLTYSTGASSVTESLFFSPPLLTTTRPSYYLNLYTSQSLSFLFFFNCRLTTDTLRIKWSLRARGELGPAGARWA